MPYVKKGPFVNGQPPAINDQVLNHFEDSFEELYQNIEEPLYQTVTSEGESVISLPSSTEDKGQVSVGLKGLTLSNLFKNPTWVNFTDWTVGNGVSRKEEQIGSAYVIQTTASSGTTRVYALQKITVQEGDILLVGVQGRTIGTVESCRLRIRWYASGDVVIGDDDLIIDTSLDSNFKWFFLKATAPTDAVEAWVYPFYDNGQKTDCEAEFVQPICLKLTSEQDAWYNDGWRPHWFDGTKSTNSVRIKDIGKNLFNTDNLTLRQNNGNDELLILNKNEFVISTIADGAYSVTKDLKLKPNTQYYIKSYPTVLSGNPTPEIGIGENGYINNILYGVQEGVFTSNDTGIVTVTAFCKTVGSIKYKIQLEEGDTATEYEPYKESVRYITLPEGVDGLHSLPNGTKDEVSEDGKLIKRVTSKTYTSSDAYDLQKGTYKEAIKFNAVSGGVFTGVKDNTSYFRGLPEVGIGGNAWDSDDGYNESYGVYSDGVLLWIFPLGTFADLTEARNYVDNHQPKLIYQLAEPVTYNLNLTPLTAFANGTVYFEKAIPEVSFYDSTNGCQVSDTKYPISSIDFIHKVNQEDGSYIELDVSQATIAGDGLSFTHPDLEDGDLVDWDYFYAEELATYPASEITVATNHKAETVSHGEAINQLSKTTQRLDDRVKANSQSIEEHETRITTNETDIDTLNTTVNSHIGSGGTAHANATQSAAGFMSASDKTKLDRIENSFVISGIHVIPNVNCPYQQTTNIAIPIGEIGKKSGFIGIYASSSYWCSIHFTDDKTETVYIYNWNETDTRLSAGQDKNIYPGSSNYGFIDTDNYNLGIKNVYISGSNIVIEVWNSSIDTDYVADQTIYWKVW